MEKIFKYLSSHLPDEKTKSKTDCLSPNKHLPKKSNIENEKLTTKIQKKKIEKNISNQYKIDASLFFEEMKVDDKNNLYISGESKIRNPVNIKDEPIESLISKDQKVITDKNLDFLELFIISRKEIKNQLIKLEEYIDSQIINQKKHLPKVKILDKYETVSETMSIIYKIDKEIVDLNKSIKDKDLQLKNIINDKLLGEKIKAIYPITSNKDKDNLNTEYHKKEKNDHDKDSQINNNKINDEIQVKLDNININDKIFDEKSKVKSNNNKIGDNFQNKDILIKENISSSKILSKQTNDKKCYDNINVEKLKILESKDDNLCELDMNTQELLNSDSKEESEFDEQCLNSTTNEEKLSNEETSDYDHNKEMKNFQLKGYDNYEFKEKYETDKSIENFPSGIKEDAYDEKKDIDEDIQSSEISNINECKKENKIDNDNDKEGKINKGKNLLSSYDKEYKGIFENKNKDKNIIDDDKLFTKNINEFSIKSKSIHNSEKIGKSPISSPKNTECIINVKDPLISSKTKENNDKESKSFTENKFGFSFNNNTKNKNNLNKINNSVFLSSWSSDKLFEKEDVIKDKKLNTKNVDVEILENIIKNDCIVNKELWCKIKNVINSSKWIIYIENTDISIYLANIDEKIRDKIQKSYYYNIKSSVINKLDRNFYLKVKDLKTKKSEKKTHLKINLTKIKKIIDNLSMICNWNIVNFEGTKIKLNTIFTLLNEIKTNNGYDSENSPLWNYCIYKIFIHLLMSKPKVSDTCYIYGWIIYKLSLIDNNASILFSEILYQISPQLIPVLFNSNKLEREFISEIYFPIPIKEIKEQLKIQTYIYCSWILITNLYQKKIDKNVNLSNIWKWISYVVNNYYSDFYSDMLIIVVQVLGGLLFREYTFLFIKLLRRCLKYIYKENKKKFDELKKISSRFIHDKDKSYCIPTEIECYLIREV